MTWFDKTAAIFAANFNLTVAALQLINILLLPPITNL